MAKREYLLSVRDIIGQYESHQYTAFLKGARKLPHHSLTEELVQLTLSLTNHRNRGIRKKANETLSSIGYS